MSSHARPGNCTGTGLGSETRRRLSFYAALGMSKGNVRRKHVLRYEATAGKNNGYFTAEIECYEFLRLIFTASLRNQTSEPNI